MPGSKMAIALALALASTAPALAGMNGTDWLNRMSSARSGQSTSQMMLVRPDQEGAWASTARSRSASEAISKSYPHRYYGGPKSLH